MSFEKFKSITDYIIEDEEGKPFIACIDWTQFAKWKGLYIPMEILGDDRNAFRVQEYAKKQGVKIEMLFYPDRVVFYVIDKYTKTESISQQQIDNIYQIICDNHPEPTENSYLRKFVGIPYPAYKKAIENLIETRKIRKLPGKPGKKGGRPSVLYEKLINPFR